MKNRYEIKINEKITRLVINYINECETTPHEINCKELRFIIRSFISNIDVIIKNIEVDYNVEQQIINVEVNYQMYNDEENYMRTLTLEYKLEDIKNNNYELCEREVDINEELRIYDKWNKNAMDEITIKKNGKIRFAGELRCPIRASLNDINQMDDYNNKYESNIYDIEVYYEGNIVDGLPEGNGRLVWDDGLMLYEGQFKKGRVDGFGRSYCFNGKISSEGYRTNGVANGKFVAYYEDGQVRFKGEKKDGSPIGYCEFYHADGCPMYKGIFDEHGWSEDILNYITEDIIYKDIEDEMFLVNEDGTIIRELTFDEYYELMEKYNR